VPSELDRREKRPEQQPLRQPQQPQQVAVPAVPQNMSIPITHSPIRVISDIDDTVKLSNILGGARAIFQNVFVKDLKESIIPGMGEFYTKMWERGVRFHYVVSFRWFHDSSFLLAQEVFFFLQSNGPFEILPIVNEFMRISGLPLGA
jgi:phosphatidate phosphatase APP1